jgi:hypothetical protein
MGRERVMTDYFNKIVHKTENRGRFCVFCPLGLWGVSAPTKEQAESEARHYFRQYFSDGEYDALIREQNL